MQFRSAGLDLTIRVFFAATLAFGATILMALPSHAGAPPQFCDYVCDLDKLCSVGVSEPQDQCVASPGEEVTYHYEVSVVVGVVEVWDDQLGFIGSTNGGTLTRTTTLSETTTNWGSLVASAAECDCDECFCAFGNPTDAVTVTVSGPTPTPSPTPCEVAHPVDTVYTIGKGQSAPNNAKVSHAITGNIIDPDRVCPEFGACTAHRIPVCAGTGVTITLTDSSGGATNSNIGKGNIACDENVCSVGAVDVTEKYKSVSADGRDTDRMSLLPQR